MEEEYEGEEEEGWEERRRGKKLWRNQKRKDERRDNLWRGSC